MNQMLKSHTRQIGGQELGFRYSARDLGFEVALRLPMGVYPAAYSEKIKAGANNWAMKLATAMPTLEPVIVEHIGREILIRGDMTPPFLDALLITLPNELQNAFVETETKSDSSETIPTQPETSSDVRETKQTPTETAEVPVEVTPPGQLKPNPWYKNLGIGVKKA